MIDAEKANYTISRMCRLLNIDRRRYYEWAKRRAAGPSAAEQRRAELTGKIVDASTGNPVGDVVVTVTSVNLQGEEIAVTGKDGTACR